MTENFIQQPALSLTQKQRANEHKRKKNVKKKIAKDRKKKEMAHNFLVKMHAVLEGDGSLHDMKLHVIASYIRGMHDNNQLNKILMHICISYVYTVFKDHMHSQLVRYVPSLHKSVAIGRRFTLS